MNLHTLPKQISQLQVHLQGRGAAPPQALGLLTHGVHYTWQPTQTKQSVSLTMQRATLDSYTAGALHPIFAQNLPEGFTRRFINERLARYAKVNDMYLLALQGENGIGMLAYQSEFALPPVEPVSLEEILTWDSAEPLFPQLLEKYYLRNALSGVQPKVGISNPSRTVEQKDLIVKTFDAEFPLLTVNEYVCMQAAKRCGLQPPNTWLSQNLETFIIERFDHFDGVSPAPQTLGYEDFTTLLKKPNTPEAKYSGSYETLLKATHAYTNSLQAVERVYRYIVFSCLIGNGNAHLKNFALQYTPDGARIFVAPPFDITHTIIYETIDNKMALKMAGSKEFPGRATLIALGSSPQFRIRHAEEIVDEMVQGILDSVQHSEAVQLFAGLKESIEQSVDRVMRRADSVKGYRHEKRRKFP